jgi:hypothetical protein
MKKREREQKKSYWTRLHELEGRDLHVSENHHQLEVKHKERDEPREDLGHRENQRDHEEEDLVVDEEMADRHEENQAAVMDGLAWSQTDHHEGENDQEIDRLEERHLEVDQIEGDRLEERRQEADQIGEDRLQGVDRVEDDWHNGK